MRGWLGALAGALVGGAVGFGAVTLWFHLQARPAGGDPLGNWAEGMSELIAAICAAVIGGLLGAVAGAIIANSNRPKRPERPARDRLQ